MEEKKIRAYKGFDKDMTCRGIQYEVGKEYEHQGSIGSCDSGFHACENPFDVLDRYGDISECRYCEVEQSGSFKQGDNKTVSSKLSIKAEIGFVGLIKAGVEYLKELTRPDKIEPDNLSDNGSDYAQIGSSADCVQIGSSGDCARIGSPGDYARIGSSGDYAQIGSSGDYAQIGSSGDCAQIGLSGDCTKIGLSGDCAKIGSSGRSAQIGSSADCAQIGSSGDCARIGSSGGYAQIGSSGDYARIGSSGGYAQIGSSGDCAQIGLSGDCAKIGSSGESAQIDSTGEDSVICCAGHNSMAKAKTGSWITLSEWEFLENKGRWVPKSVKTEYVDGERIKADTWYRLEDGEFVEAK